MFTYMCEFINICCIDLYTRSYLSDTWSVGRTVIGTILILNLPCYGFVHIIFFHIGLYRLSYPVNAVAMGLDMYLYNNQY